MTKSPKEEISITGMVGKKPEKFLLKADDGEYLVTGHDLSEMVGKKVKATESA